MNINLPLPVIVDCLKTSAVFRHHVAMHVCQTPITKAEVESVFLHFAQTNQKIAAIKRLREYSFENPRHLEAIQKHYPALFEAHDKMLMLGSAKKIVELYC